VVDQVLSRVFGVLEGLSMAAMGTGMLLVPALFALLSGRGIFIVFALSLPVLALLTRRRLNAIDAGTSIPAIRVNLLRSVPFFAPLSPDLVDALAAHLVPVEWATGSIIIRQGEAGDRFYIIAEGQVRVERNGVPVDAHGPGGYFGEIALLRDVPRTATVVAVSDVRLYALERQPFLEAITRHPQSIREAETITRARMGEREEEAIVPPA
jgi:hypothetical protein